MHFTLSASVATVLALLVAQVAAAPVPGSSELGARAYGGKADPETLKKTEKIFQDALAKAKKNPTSTGPCGGLGCLPGGSWKRDVQEEAAPAVEEAPELAVRAYGSKTADPETLKKTEQLARAELNKAKKHPKLIGPCGGLGCLPGGSWKRDVQEEAAPAVEEAPELAVRAYGSKTADPETLKKTERLARAELNKAKKHPKLIGPCGGLGCLPGGSWKRGVQE